MLIYFFVFGVLISSTVIELGIVGLRISPVVITTSILGFAGLKAVLIAMFFQHLKDEPRSLSFLLLIGLTTAIILITISLLSVVGSRS